MSFSLWGQYAEALGERIDAISSAECPPSPGPLLSALSQADLIEALALDVSALQLEQREARAQLQAVARRGEEFWGRVGRAEKEAALASAEIRLARSLALIGVERDVSAPLCACSAELRVALEGRRGEHEGACASMRVLRLRTEGDVQWRLFCCRLEQECLGSNLSVTPLSAEQILPLQGVVSSQVIPKLSRSERRSCRIARAATLTVHRGNHSNGMSAAPIPPSPHNSPACSRQGTSDSSVSLSSGRGVRGVGSLTSSPVCSTRGELDRLLARLCGTVIGKDPAVIARDAVGMGKDAIALAKVASATERETIEGRTAGDWHWGGVRPLGRGSPASVEQTGGRSSGTISSRERGGRRVPAGLKARPLFPINMRLSSLLLEWSSIDSLSHFDETVFFVHEVQRPASLPSYFASSITASPAHRSSLALLGWRAGTLPSMLHRRGHRECR